MRNAMTRNGIPLKKKTSYNIIFHAYKKAIISYVFILLILIAGAKRHNYHGAHFMWTHFNCEICIQLTAREVKGREKK